MTARPPDRRVRRTKHRLKLALLELIQERGYDAITVEDITERADVGRSTFYSHFMSKEDLLFAGFDEWLRSLTEPPRSAGATPRFHFSRPLLEHIRGQRRFFLATMVRGHDARIRQRTMTLFAELARLELERMETLPDPRRLEARAHAVAGAFFGLVTWWLAGPTRLDVAEVDEVFQLLATGVSGRGT